jgi:hypothetical protein
MDKKLEESREKLRQTFKEYPEVKKAYVETIEELKKPENMKRMVDNTVKFMEAIQKLQEEARRRK